jgi:hypothetical protein
MIEAVKRMIYKSREEKDEDKMIVLRDPDVEGSILATDSSNDDEWMSSPDYVYLDDMV